MVTDQHWFRLANSQRKYIKPVRHVNSSLNEEDEEENGNKQEKSFSDAFEELLEEEEEGVMF